MFANLHRFRLLLAAAPLLAGLPAHADPPRPPPPAVEKKADLPEVPPPPAWMQWHGWSDDGKQLCWREGKTEQQMARGQPVEIATVDRKGAIVKREHIVENPAAVLEERHIHVHKAAETEAVTPADVLVRALNQQLFAVVLRGAPPIVAVLERRGAEYEPIAQWPVRGPAQTLKVTAAEDDGHRLLALIVHTGEGKSQQGTLLVLPLRPGSAINAPADLPAAATPATPDAAKRASP